MTHCQWLFICCTIEWRSLIISIEGFREACAFGFKGVCILKSRKLFNIMLELFRSSVNSDYAYASDRADIRAPENKNMSAYTPAYSTILEHISLVTYWHSKSMINRLLRNLLNQFCNPWFSLCIYIFILNVLVLKLTVDDQHFFSHVCTSFSFLSLTLNSLKICSNKFHRSLTIL